MANIKKEGEITMKIRENQEHWKRLKEIQKKTKQK